MHSMCVQVTVEVSTAEAEFMVLDREPLDTLTAKFKLEEESQKAIFMSEEIPVFR